MPRPVKRLIVPVTFAEDSLEAVAVAARLAVALDAELVLAGIAPLAPPEPSLNGATGTETVLRQADEQKLVDQLVSERLEELVEGLSGGVRARTLLTWGPVGGSLLEAAREQPRPRGDPDATASGARARPPRPCRPLRAASQRRPGPRRAH